MSSVKPMDEKARLTRLEHAIDWLLRIENPARSEEDINEWLRWCDADPENLAAFEALQRDWRDLDALRGKPSSESLKLLPGSHGNDFSYASGPERTTKDQQFRGVPIPNTRWQNMRFPLAVAACLLLIVVAFSVFRTEQNASPLQQQVAANQVNRAATLPDGSRVILSTQTSVSVDFNEAKRNLELSDGEAYFKVKHDRTHPFIVHAGDISITAVGTAFDVRRDPAGVTVTVEEGTVEIAGNQFASQGLPATWRAEAGYQLRYSSLGRTATLTSVNTSNVLEWRHGELSYVWEPLGAVVEDLNQYSNRKVIIESPALAELRFTGTVFTASLDDWVRGIEQAYPVSARRAADGDIVLTERH